jgi:D-alanyl-lipoteichoic acid acyltransferase DltB (MBOAT superfamily)
MDGTAIAALNIGLLLLALAYNCRWRERLAVVVPVMFLQIVFALLIDGAEDWTYYAYAMLVDAMVVVYVWMVGDLDLNAQVAGLNLASCSVNFCGLLLHISGNSPTAYNAALWVLWIVQAAFFMRVTEDDSRQLAKYPNRKACDLLGRLSLAHDSRFPPEEKP